MVQFVIIGLGIVIAGLTTLLCATVSRDPHAANKVLRLGCFGTVIGVILTTAALLDLLFGS